MLGKVYTEFRRVLFGKIAAGAAATLYIVQVKDSV